MLLIPTSAVIQEAELCVSQLPPYEQSITVSVSLQSALAPFFFFFSSPPAHYHALLSEERAAIYRIPQMTVQTYFQIQRQHLATSPIGIKHMSCHNYARESFPAFFMWIS